MYTVDGEVALRDGGSAHQVRVRVFDRDMRRFELLGETRTDRAGRYSVKFQWDGQPREKKGPDLVVHVFDAHDKVIATSPIVFNAGPEQRIDVVIEPKGGYRPPSELERYARDVELVAEGVAIHDLTDDDIEFLHGELEIPVERLRFMRLDAKTSREHKWRPGVLYALFRGGLPTDFAKLLRSGRPAWEKAVESAFEQDILPAAFKKELDPVLDRLEEMAVEQSFEEPKEGPAPIGAVLKGTGIADGDLRKVTAQYLRESKVDAGNVWERVAASGQIDPKIVGAARFATEAHELVLGDLATLRVVQKSASTERWTAVRDLARIGRDGWRALVKQSGSVPKGFEGPEAYADAIDAKIEARMPTARIAFRLARESGGLRSAGEFFLANPDVDVLSTSIDKMFEGATVPPDVDLSALRVDVAKVMRVARIVPAAQRAEGSMVLLSHEYDSATKITMIGRAKFTKSLAEKMAEAWIAEVYERARERAEYAELLRVRALDFVGGTTVTPSVPLTGTLPTWARMFGSTSNCECQHCRSVLSPAAYFTDLLRFIEDAPPPPAGVARLRPAIDVLFERRPDLQGILLDCDNSNVRLPHIDLVNELLEDLVIGAPLAARQTTGTEAERRAIPSGGEPAAAYANLAAASLPFVLPFDLPHEKALAFAEQLGIELHLLWKLFGRASADVDRARLGVSAREWALLDSEAPSWGLRTGEDIANVVTFLDRAEISYSDLEVLVGTGFFTANGPITINRGERKCDITDDKLDGLTAEAGTQIQRFLRLSRRLGWLAVDGTASPLANVLAALGHARIDAVVIGDVLRARDMATALRLRLDKVVELNRTSLAAALRTSVEELDAFAMLIGRDVTTSLNERIAIVEAWRDFRPAGVDPRELAHVLTGWDQTPAAFAPANSELETLLRDLHGLAAEHEGDEREVMAIENLSTALEVDVSIVAALLRRTNGLLHRQSDPTHPAIEDLANWFADPATTVATLEPAMQLLRRLYRIAKLVRGLHLDARELEIAAAVRSDNDFLNLDSIVDGAAPTAIYDGWLQLAKAKQLQRVLPRADRDLFDQLRDAATPDGIATDTGWRADDLAVLIPVFGSLRSAATYDRLLQAVTWLRRAGVSGERLAAWGRSTDAAALAQSLEESVHARLVLPADLYRVLGPINDRLRESRRDALLAYVVHVVNRPDGVRRFQSRADVYAALLLDPEMASCALTSRIVQATASVQMFVQRCQMGIEPEVMIDVTEEYWAAWEWMKAYRVWEANRKVFLYPENWLEPDLRHDKSDVFRELENALQRDELRDEHIEDTVRGYLETLGTVSNLDVRGLFHEVDRGVLHVVARTHAAPHVYYYRRRLPPSDAWTPWEPLDLDIQSDHVMPVVYRGRCYVFWPVFEDKIEEGPINASSETFRVFHIAWSEYRNGRWQAREIATVSLACDAKRPDQLTFKVMEDENGDLLIRVYVVSFLTVPEHEANDFSELKLPLHFSVVQLRFDACARTLVQDATAPRRYYMRPQRTHPTGMFFTEITGGLTSRNEDPLYGTLQLGDDLAHDIPVELMRLLTEGHLPGLIFGAFLIAGYVTNNEWGGLLGTREEYRLLHTTPTQTPLLDPPRATPFRLLPAHQAPQFILGEHPFFFTCEGASYVVSPFFRFTTDIYHSHRFEVFTHPFACVLREVLHREGIDRVFRGSLERADRWPAKQRALDRTLRFRPDGFRAHIEPNDVDFTANGAYSGYNWELFFHVPLLVAERLSKSGRFEQAERWFRRIFDPTDTFDSRIPGTPRIANVWQTRPLFEEAERPLQTLDDLVRLLSAGDTRAMKQLQAWRARPFDPHAIAQLRVGAYMRSVVMKYLDHLIAWADDLFRTDTRESINQAAQLYVIAAALLGERPVTISRDDVDAVDYQGLRDHLDEFANAMIEFETGVPADLAPPDRRGTPPPPRFVHYYCVPRNEKLLGYWDTVADRLFKIRNCMDIEGRIRDLALFAPPIDPALLIRARAAGVDLQQAIRGLREPPVHHRFAVLYQKAVEACSDLRAHSAALLGALEKKDAEELARLRSKQEITMLSLIRNVRQAQIEESAQTIGSLRASLESATQRKAYYGGRDLMNEAEIAALALHATAHVIESAGQALAMGAAWAHIVPQTHIGIAAAVEAGGKQIGDPMVDAQRMISFIAAQFSYAANLTSTMSGYERRKEDWDFQADLATTDIKQIERQIVAAEIRKAIAEQELANHEVQTEHAREMESFLRDKFTNRELYGWMSSQIGVLHRQAYQHAYELAKRAEAAARRELGMPAGDSFAAIGFEHWDGPQRGLLAGEKLLAELRAMEAEFLRRNQRELEITKHISLARLAPSQLLALRATGSCTFATPEVLFDLDFPGHYRRRIKAVTVTIPCVKGPHTSISATLRLGETQVRWSAIGEPEIVPPQPTAAIATSAAQGDGGVFELNFRDERFLPFEGGGVVGTWTVDLPSTFRSFDYETISDVILTLHYTALEDNVRRDEVIANLDARLNEWLGELGPLARAFSAREELSTELHAFRHPPGDANHTLALDIQPKHFPYFLRDRSLALLSTASIEVWFITKSRELVGVPVTVHKGSGSIPPQEIRSDQSVLDGMPHARFSVAGSVFGGLRVELPRALIPDVSVIDDVVVVLGYQIR